MGGSQTLTLFNQTFFSLLPTGSYVVYRAFKNWALGAISESSGVWLAGEHPERLLHYELHFLPEGLGFQSTYCPCLKLEWKEEIA